MKLAGVNVPGPRLRRFAATRSTIIKQEIARNSKTEEIPDVRRIGFYLPLLILVLCATQFANAQSSFDLNIGFGAVQAKAASQGLDQNTLLNCNLGSATTCVSTPSLNSFMLGFGGSLMLWKHFGVGGEASVQPSREKYATLSSAIPSLGQPEIDLQSRVTFYDFNGIWQPIATKKAALRLEGGIGGTNLKFYENVNGANAVIGSYNSSQYAGSSNHFQVHGGIGVQIFVTDHIFVKPQFDVHYTHNFSQFGTNLVTSEMVWIGYSFGDR
jgi:Outer membrane protein beta-barrel domain